MTFSWIRERVEEGTLALHGWYFDIARGELLGFNAATRQFEVL
jgi:carbonic anhydrase